jgi:hypothetical protein
MGPIPRFHVLARASLYLANAAALVHVECNHQGNGNVSPFIGYDTEP